MRIGIDCRTVLDPDSGEKAGVGHYTSYLVKHLVAQYPDEDFVLFFDHRMPQNEYIHGLTAHEHVEVVRFPLSQYKKYLPLGYSHLFIAKFLKQQTLDLFHSPAYAIPLQYNKPSIVTVHDLAIYTESEWFPPNQQFSKKILVPKSIKKASKVIAVSHSTEKMIRELFDVPSHRISVVYEGVEKTKRFTKKRQEEIRTVFGINDRYLFFVSTIEPRKNIVHMVKAFDQFMDEQHKRHKDLQLVIAGGKGWKHEPIFAAIARAKWSSNIRVIGYVTQEEKMALMQSALFFIFPSLWEGFGLPVLEAASMGVPILTSAVSALPEVAGDGALYVRPTSVQDIQNGITKLVQSASKRNALGKRAKEQSKQFTWKRVATETMAVYNSVLYQDQAKSVLSLS